MSASPVYTLHVTFKSNEHPWSTTYTPAGWIAKDRPSAERWAAGMQEGMGGNYICVLLQDGMPIFDASAPAAADTETLLLYGRP